MPQLPLRFDLDEATERQAEEAASRYVSFLPPGYNGYLAAQREVLPPNGASAGPYALGAVAGFGAGPNPMPGANFGVPGFPGSGPTGNWATGHPGDFSWVGGGPMTSMPITSEVVLAGATGPTVAPIPGQAVSMVPAPVAMTAPSHELQPPTPSPIVVETPAIVQEVPREAMVETIEKIEEVVQTQTESPKNEAPPQQAVAGTDGSTTISSPPMLPEGATTDTEPPAVTVPSPITTATPRATGSTASPKGQASPGGSTPSRTWANIVSKDKEDSNAQACSMTLEEMKSSRKDSIIDYLLLLARAKEDSADGPVDVPEELRKFKNATESGMQVCSKAKYNRRGMRNTENNCYVNVIIQSLLPCSALMQILSHCSPDYERPFHTGMHKLCREFHSKSHTEALDVLGLPQVKKIISDWQSLGAQQDAGEFLFYLLNGLHDECKWKIVPDEGTSSSSQDTGKAAREGGEGEQSSKDDEQLRPDVRSSGDHEDSPVFRIFGGIIRSSVQARNSRTDSVSLEPFNGLTLDISSSSVDSVWSALEAYCGKEDVNEGNATKRLQFKAVPRVLILNLKRFSYSKDTGYPQKIRKTVKFDERLTFDRSWLVDDVEPREYQLTAVICHFGDLVTGGHYTAAVKYNSDWYNYDDVLLRQIDFREVSQLAPHAYLLLYQCHDRVDIRP